MRAKPKPQSRRRCMIAAAVSICMAVSSGASFPLPAAEADSAAFRAGAAKVEIKTPLGMPIVGNWDSPPATNIHDELYVRCLLLDDGHTRIAFAICDNVGIPREVFDAARKLIDAETDVDAKNVLMSATHTHSGVSARDFRMVDGAQILSAYQQLVARRIADAVATAEQRLQPAQIGWGSAAVPSEVHNRRWYVDDEKLLSNPFGGVDQVRMNPPRGNDALVKPAGPTDPEVSFISVQTRDGQPLALLANYSLHYVGGVPTGDISADYFAAFSERIGGLLGVADADSDFVGIMTNGTSGDINNIPFREKNLPPKKAYERIDEVSKLVAEEVASASRSVAYHNQISLAAANAELKLAMRKPDPEMLRYFASLAGAEGDSASTHRFAKIYASRVSRLQEGPDEVSILLQAFRIGDLGVMSIPFEVFAETGLDLKKRSPFDDSFTIELANGSYGYLPTPAQHKLGGYETWMGTNRVQLDASEKISDVLLSLSKQIQSP
ncbi:hypothetical protein [Allorhodopirellula heiligendammensis]|uniref:Neutral/alkaline non-lysosomal ceramidase n=1 Tax=Allorhodopirellula heiligendammensis TaxID=2714739 RepID=A0A5C6BF75_9BACT|nr:hypothetical protein [Allorhodopirellula heiligendammensis]TWU10793.1 Neutral/alkaline non-lysosomal ceramidase [Allorhodopirellula heiligendammensis]